MNKIQKLLARLQKKDRQRIEAAIELILTQQWDTLDIKKLSGTNGWRVRIGDFRIKFIEQEKRIIIYDIQRRSSHTY